VSDFQKGADASDDGYDEQECASVKSWLKRIEEARKFDEGKRKQIAIDRRYADGDAGNFDVPVDLCGSYVDILKSILWARNPDLSIQPAESVNPPPMADVIEMARNKISMDPATHQMMEQVGMQAAQQAVQAKQIAMQGMTAAELDPMLRQKIALAGADPNETPEEIGERAAQAWLNAKIKEEARRIMEPHRKRLTDAKQLGKSLELVIQRLWKKGNLKGQGKQQVASTISVSGGWLKGTWQDRKGQDPVIAEQIRDAQDQLARLEAKQADLERGDVTDVDAERAEIENILSGLEAKVEIIIDRGMAWDFVRYEDGQVSTEVSLENYLDAEWMAHRCFMLVEVAKARFPKVADKIKRASVYFQQKPPDPQDKAARHVGAVAALDIDSKEADSFRSGPSLVGTTSEISGGNVCVWEVQHKVSGKIITLIEGLDYYAEPPYDPVPSSRFYSLFHLAFVWVDGKRYPKSLVERSAKLFDEVNRLYSNFAEHRRRAIPKNVFNSGSMDPSEVQKIEQAGTAEMVGIRGLNPETPVGNLIQTFNYPKVDAALYDDHNVMAKLEIMFGVQEALASSITTAKTATEAEIQQTGTNARSSFKRDALNEELDDIAQYTAEIAMQKMSFEDVKEIVGPWAFWPEGMTIQDMSSLVTVSIKAGSSGKPDTSAQQQAWSVSFPILKNAVMDIGRLRQSDPSDIADCFEELVSETLARTGDHLDPSRFLPHEPSTEPGQMPTQPNPIQQQAGPAPNPAQPPTMPAQQKPPTNQDTLPVPHNGHVLQ